MYNDLLLKSSHRKCCDRHGDFLTVYGIYVSQMTRICLVCSCLVTLLVQMPLTKDELLTLYIWNTNT